ncbi:MAG: CHRD domain-containing protein [Pontibacter sp.]|nr:CHRD domain-containing protein [Pontibacter sp.]
MQTNALTKKLLASLCLFGLLITGTSCDKEDDDTTPAAEIVNFNNVMLSSQQEVPENTSNATGNYTLVYDKTSNSLNYTINYSGTTPTAMHFHKGDIGVAGGVVAEVPGPYTSGMKGKLMLTEAQEADLLAGKLYLNVHSAAFAAGELRGQAVTEDKVVLSNIKLSGNQEVPSNNSTATGTMNGLYDKTTKKLDYSIVLNGVTATAMHLHKAAVGANGDVVMEITGLKGTTAAFTAAQETDLLEGNLYLNVHSAAQPGGELRGQVVSDQKVVFSNRLSGQNEVPQVNTSATGTFYGVYDKATKKLTYNIAYSGVTPTGMHFHKAAAGANGDVEIAVAGPYSSGMTGSVTLTAAQEADLLKGLWYLNVHSAAHAGGEVRAQLVK